MARKQQQRDDGQTVALARPGMRTYPININENCIIVEMTANLAVVQSEEDGELYAVPWDRMSLDEVRPDPDFMGVSLPVKDPLEGFGKMKIEMDSSIAQGLSEVAERITRKDRAEAAAKLEKLSGAPLPPALEHIKNSGAHEPTDPGHTGNGNGNEKARRGSRRS